MSGVENNKVERIEKSMSNRGLMIVLCWVMDRIRNQ